jgi:hypothetical protein
MWGEVLSEEGGLVDELVDVVLVEAGHNEDCSGEEEEEPDREAGEVAKQSFEGLVLHLFN